MNAPTSTARGWRDDHAIIVALLPQQRDAEPLRVIELPDCAGAGLCQRCRWSTCSLPMHYALVERRRALLVLFVGLVVALGLTAWLRRDDAETRAAQSWADIVRAYASEPGEASVVVSFERDISDDDLAGWPKSHVMDCERADDCAFRAPVRGAAWDYGGRTITFDVLPGTTADELADLLGRLSGAPMVTGVFVDG